MLRYASLVTLLLYGSAMPAAEDARGVAARSFERILNMQAATISEGVVSTAGCDQFTSTMSCSTTRTDRIDSADCYLSGTSTYVEFHRLPATAGQPITLTLTSTSGYNFLVAIQDYDDGTIRTSKFGKSSIQLTYTPPATEYLIIGIGIVEPFGSGPYTFKVACGTTGTPDCNARVILPGTTVGSLAAGDCRWPNTTDDYLDLYRVAVRADETVRVVMSSEFPAYLDMYEADYPTEGVYAHTGNTVTTYLTASEDGYIEFIVSSYDGTSGGYSVNVSLEQLPGCRRRAVRH